MSWQKGKTSSSWLVFFLFLLSRCPFCVLFVQPTRTTTRRALLIKVERQWMDNKKATTTHHITDLYGGTIQNTSIHTLSCLSYQHQTQPLH